MYIGVDAQRLAGQRLGVGRYIEYLVRHWVAMLDEGDRLSLFVRTPIDESGLPKSPKLSLERLTPGLPGLAWQNLVLPRRARSTDVLFCPSYSTPLWYDAPCVVAIHSANEVQAGAHPWWYRLRYTEVYRRSAERADRIVVPSESTRADLVEHYGIAADKMVVVPQGADEAFRPLHDDDLLRRTRLRWLGADRPYILWVGKLSQRRNIPLLVEAFALLKERHDVPHALLLMGPNHVDLPLAQIVSALGLEGDVIQTDGRVDSHHELVPVYAGADLYVNPSMYEGFSMTLVEALSCGTPVVANNRAALAEIAGGHALMLDDPDAEDLADAMYRVISDPALASDLREKALRRAERFRWDRTARATLDVLRDAAGVRS